MTTAPGEATPEVPLLMQLPGQGSFIVVHRHTLTQRIVVCEAGIDPTDIQPHCRLNESSQ